MLSLLSQLSWRLAQSWAQNSLAEWSDSCEIVLGSLCSPAARFCFAGLGFESPTQQSDMTSGPRYSGVDHGVEACSVEACENVQDAGDKAKDIIDSGKDAVCSFF